MFLEYIDSLSLRQNVQKALNRGESYHKLRRSVSYANFGKLRFKTEQDQQIWNECGGYSQIVLFITMRVYCQIY
ncbi:Tn3 transposase DDE domain protein (plasmid) [Bacillus cereus]|nr:Tn3 transposase DDE domain protein [Bacillus cereus]